MAAGLPVLIKRFQRLAAAPSNPIIFKILHTKMIHHCSSFVFAVLVFVAAIAATSTSVHSKETLIITGTGTSIGTMRLMAAEFRKQQPSITVIILPSIGSNGGIMAVNKNKIDIGLSSRRLKPEEQGMGIMEEPYGRTAVIFGVQASNPVKGFTLGEIEEVSSGKRKAWSDGTPIRLILRPQSDTFSEYLARINSTLKSASAKALSIPGVFVGITDQDAADQIERTAGSFGITSAALISSENRKIKALSIDDISPTPANVSAGVYPYTVILSLVYKRDKCKGAVKSFLEFVFSRDGRQVLLKNGHVSVSRSIGR